MDNISDAGHRYVGCHHSIMTVRFSHHQLASVQGATQVCTIDCIVIMSGKANSDAFGAISSFSAAESRVEASIFRLCYLLSKSTGRHRITAIMQSTIVFLRVYICIYYHNQRY